MKLQFAHSHLCPYAPHHPLAHLPCSGKNAQVNASSFARFIWISKQRFCTSRLASHLAVATSIVAMGLGL